MDNIEFVDKLILLGKTIYYQIPGGDRCKGCLLVSETRDWKGIHYSCKRRSSIALMFDETGPFKDCGLNEE